MDEVIFVGLVTDRDEDIGFTRVRSVETQEIYTFLLVRVFLHDNS